MKDKRQEVSNFIIMKIGKIRDGLEITKEMIEKTIDKKRFNYAPIVTRNGTSQIAIGFITPNTARINGNDVVADVVLWDRFEDRTCFDTWTILFDNNEVRSYIKNYCCELYKVVNKHEK